MKGKGSFEDLAFKTWTLKAFLLTGEDLSDKFLKRKAFENFLLSLVKIILRMKANSLYFAELGTYFLREKPRSS